MLHVISAWCVAPHHPIINSTWPLQHYYYHTITTVNSHHSLSAVSKSHRLYNDYFNHPIFTWSLLVFPRILPPIHCPSTTTTHLPFSSTICPPPPPPPPSPIPSSHPTSLICHHTPMGGSEKFWFYWKTKKISSRGPGATQALVGSRGKALGRGPVGLSPPSSHSFLHLFFFSSASISRALVVSLSWTEPGIAHGKKKEEIFRGARGHAPPENFESRD